MRTEPVRCHHYCNTTNCATCIQAFWRWAENYTQGRGRRAESRSRAAGGVTFYEAAGRFIEVDNRARRPS